MVMDLGLSQEVYELRNYGGLRRKSLRQPPFGDSPVFTEYFFKLAVFVTIPENFS